MPWPTYEKEKKKKVEVFDKQHLFLHSDRVMYSGFVIFTILVEQTWVSNLNINKEYN